MPSRRTYTHVNWPVGRAGSNVEEQEKTDGKGVLRLRSLRHKDATADGGGMCAFEICACTCVMGAGAGRHDLLHVDEWMPGLVWPGLAWPGPVQRSSAQPGPAMA
eukprot:363769-Chlamydomonas_euryale.AAC.10